MTGTSATVTRKKCPGCSISIGTRSEWCARCELRMPADLQKRVAAARIALDRATAAGISWLGQHPRATERELEILELAAQGLSNQAIGEKLHIELNTVRSAWKDLSKRWGCTGRAHVVAQAFQLGYLTVQRREVP